jgi:hypothetical protein
MPMLDDAGVKLVAVGIGTPERGQEFCDLIAFPRENLYSDPTSECYGALGLYKGVGRTFFNPRTPYSIAERIQRDGGQELLGALSRWKPWIPPESSQALQQGGTFVFVGRETVFEHFDQSTGDHADLKLVLAAAIPTRAT